MEKLTFKEFLQKKNINISYKKYFVDAMGSMALGLFASLLIGTIIKTIAGNIPMGDFSEILLTVGNFTTEVTGAAMAVAIGYALSAPPLVLFSLVAVGHATNALGGAGGPLAVFIVAIVACELGKLVSKETKVDILVTPAVTIIPGILLAMAVGPLCNLICSALGTFVGWSTNLAPLLMGIVVSVVVGVILTLPISSAAICAAMGLSGGAVLSGLTEGTVDPGIWNGLSLAGGAAVIGCSCQMLGYAVISFRDNGVGGLVAQGLGTSMLQVPNLMKKPILWIPPIITSAILGPIGTCLFQFRNNGAAITSGMGTCGFVGQIGVITGWADLPEGFAITGMDIFALILLTLAGPIIINLILGAIFRKSGILKPGDLKLNLG